MALTGDVLAVDVDVMWMGLLSLMRLTEATVKMRSEGGGGE